MSSPLGSKAAWPSCVLDIPRIQHQGLWNVLFRNNAKSDPLINCLLILHVMILFTNRDAKLAYEKLIERTGVEGSVVLPEVNPRAEVKEIESNSVEKMFQSFYSSRYRQFIGTLKFGEELTSSVSLCPPPLPFNHTADFEVVEAQVEQIMEIKGVIPFSIFYQDYFWSSNTSTHRRQSLKTFK